MTISGRKSIFSDARLSQQMLSVAVRPLLPPLEPIVLILCTNENLLRAEVPPRGSIVLILRTNASSRADNIDSAYK